MQEIKPETTWEFSFNAMAIQKEIRQRGITWEKYIKEAQARVGKIMLMAKADARCNIKANIVW